MDTVASTMGVRPRCLYIFLDEGGNFDFSPTGSKYFTLTGVTRERPLTAYSDLVELKYDVLEDGLNIEYFHATADKQRVRDKVFAIIERHIAGTRIDVIVVEKNKTFAALREVERFFCKMLGSLLRYIINGHDLSLYAEVIVITDRLPHKGRRDLLEKAVKLTMAGLLPEALAYRILHHESKSNFYLQVADYCNWAIFRKWERDDERSYTIIKGAIASEWEIFKAGIPQY